MAAGAGRSFCVIERRAPALGRRTATGRGRCGTFRNSGGVHAHDDSGVAVANSLAAVRGGACLVQGTANGVGERTGNANLNAIIGALALKGSQICKEGIDVACSSNLHLLADSARFVDETLNLIPRKSQPYVGASAFAHKGGLHVSALAKDAAAYEHVDPARVGNEQRALVSG